MPQGTVKWFNDDKGFGFIAVDDDSNDAFVHVSALTDAASLGEGQRVDFEVSESPKGLRANNVVVVS